MELSKFALTDKTAMVTGACGRMGKEIALAFADAGAHVAVVDRQSEVEAIADQVRAKGRKSLASLTDLTKREQVNDVVSKVEKELGELISWSMPQAKMRMNLLFWS